MHFAPSRRRPRTHQNKLCAFVGGAILFILLRGMGQAGGEPGGMNPQNAPYSPSSLTYRDSSEWKPPHLDHGTFA